MDIHEIQNKFASKVPLTEDEAVHFIKSNPYALSAFMIENNPGGLNQILREMGYSNLKFAPDPLALSRQLHIIIDQKHTEDWNSLLSKFHVDPNKIPASFLNKLMAGLNGVSTNPTVMATKTATSGTVTGVYSI